MITNIQFWPQFKWNDNSNVYMKWDFEIIRCSDVDYDLILHANKCQKLANSDKMRQKSLKEVGSKMSSKLVN